MRTAPPAATHDAVCRSLSPCACTRNPPPPHPAGAPGFPPSGGIGCCRGRSIFPGSSLSVCVCGLGVAPRVRPADLKVRFFLSDQDRLGHMLRQPDWIQGERADEGVLNGGCGQWHQRRGQIGCVNPVTAARASIAASACGRSGALAGFAWSCPPQHLPERVAVGHDEDQSADGMAPACKICIKTY